MTQNGASETAPGLTPQPQGLSPLTLSTRIKEASVARWEEGLLCALQVVSASSLTVTKTVTEMTACPPGGVTIGPSVLLHSGQGQPSPTC